LVNLPEESPIGHNRKLQVAPPGEILNPFGQIKESKSTDIYYGNLFSKHFTAKDPC
jgi:hypothetical protein